MAIYKPVCVCPFEYCPHVNRTEYTAIVEAEYSLNIVSQILSEYIQFICIHTRMYKSVCMCVIIKFIHFKLTFIKASGWH